MCGPTVQGRRNSDFKVITLLVAANHFNHLKSAKKAWNLETAVLKIKSALKGELFLFELQEVAKHFLSSVDSENVCRLLETDVYVCFYS